jgi:hypothetical protein
MLKLCICQTNLILEYLSDLPINEMRMSALNIVVIVVVKISAQLRPYQQSGNFDKRAVAEKLRTSLVCNFVHRSDRMLKFGMCFLLTLNCFETKNQLIIFIRSAGREHQS